MSRIPLGGPNISFRVATQTIDEFYRRHSASPRMWELDAVTLRYAVEVLFRQAFADTGVKLRHRRRKSLRPSLHTPGLMLAGMMIEAASKAVLVVRGLPFSHLKDHNLVKTVAATRYALTADDRYFLSRLSEFVRWAGRYPVPVSSQRMAVETPGGGRELVGGSLLGDDLKRARKIADGLEAMLPGTRVRAGMRLPSGGATAIPWQRRRGR